MNPNNTQLKSAEEWMLEFGRIEADNTLDRIKPRLSENLLPEVSFYQSVLTEQDIKQIQLNAYKAGMTEACKVIQQRADNYDEEYGHTDMETGTREYPKHGDEYMLELTEIIETIAEARDKKETL